MRLRTHHRSHPYRPPRESRQGADEGGRLYRRFLREYVHPYRWLLGAAALVVAVNSSSVYILSFYNRVVVDHVLEIRPEEPGTLVSQRPGSAGHARYLRPRGLPASGEGSRFEPGVRFRRRAPEAGRRLLLLLAAYVGTVLGLQLMMRWVMRLRVRVGRRITEQLRLELHLKILRLPLSFHKVYEPGQLLARIMSDLEVMQRQLMQTIFQTVNCLAMFFVGLAILVRQDWRLALLVLTVLPLYGALYYHAQPRLRQINRELRHTNSCLYGLTTQKMDAIRTIQSYAREGGEALSFHRLAAMYLRDTFLQVRMSGRLGLAAQALSTGMTGAVFLLGARMVLAGNLSIGNLLFINSVAATLLAPVVSATHLTVTFNFLFVIMQRVTAILDQPLEMQDQQDADNFPVPLRKDIALRQVSFRYPIKDLQRDVIQEVSLSVPAGTSLCIMGPSGSGKSTVLYLLARLYEANQGLITYDGVPVARLRATDLRDHVGLVPQEAQIFSGTVRENIGYGRPEAEPCDIIAAARAAEIHDFIMTMPVQYETMLGEKGVSLSGGQRQRLSLARALLTSPEVLLLDDCTSALDAHTERRIQETLMQVLTEKTAVVVSQRASMAMRCDRIAILTAGRITELGTHAELLAAGGYYARLFRQQTADGTEESTV